MRDVIVETQRGRYHRAGIVERPTSGPSPATSLFTQEACNLDDADRPLRVLEALPPDVASDALCGRCFALPAEVPA